LPIAVTPNHRRSDQAITQFSQNWMDCKKHPPSTKTTVAIQVLWYYHSC
jgi:hypothetical protein